MLVGFPATAEPVTLLAFGDSLTAGYGLTQSEGFVPQLEAWLADHGEEAVVINAGVSGDTTAGGASRIGWALTPEVDAVIVTLGGNDLLRGFDPAETRANLDAILGEIEIRNLPTLLVGMTALGNYGQDYADAFNAIYPALAEAHGVALFPSFLAGLEAVGDRQKVLTDYMLGDGIHPNAAGVALIVEAIGPAVLELAASADPGPDR